MKTAAMMTMMERLDEWSNAKVRQNKAILTVYGIGMFMCVKCVMGFLEVIDW